MRAYFHLCFPAMHVQAVQLRMNMRARRRDPGPGLDLVLGRWAGDAVGGVWIRECGRLGRSNGPFDVMEVDLALVVARARAVCCGFTGGTAG
jgi:hypothetical protein